MSGPALLPSDGNRLFWIGTFSSLAIDFVEVSLLTETAFRPEGVELPEELESATDGSSLTDDRCPSTKGFFRIN